MLIFQEKQLIQKKKKEIEEADEARRGKVVVTFDLLGRKVAFNDIFWYNFLLKCLLLVTYILYCSFFVRYSWYTLDLDILTMINGNLETSFCACLYLYIYT